MQDIYGYWSLYKTATGLSNIYAFLQPSFCSQWAPMSHSQYSQSEPHGCPLSPPLVYILVGYPNQMDKFGRERPNLAWTLTKWPRQFTFEEVYLLMITYEHMFNDFMVFNLHIIQPWTISCLFLSFSSWCFKLKEKINSSICFRISSNASYCTFHITSLDILVLELQMKYKIQLIC